MLALAVEQRLLPASVVNDEVKERAEKLAEEQATHRAGKPCAN